MNKLSEEMHSFEKGVALRKRSRREIVAVQGPLLRAHLEHAATTPFYQQLFEKSGIDTSAIESVQDLADLPFTTRQDIDCAPDLFGIADELKVRDIALTSGTTGSPIKVPYTEKDLARLAFNEAIAFYSAGVRAEDRVLLTVTLDRCFIAGLAYYSGITYLGAAAIRSGPGSPERQWQIMNKIQPTVLVGVPTFLLELGRWGATNLFDLSGSSVAKIITIGEPARKPDCTLTPVGQELQELWGAEVFSSYGATELETAFGECSAGQGGHIHPELMLVEIVGEDDRVLQDGEPGEIVVTPMGVEGFPLVRFRTGDVARVLGDSCSCGWNTKRLGPIEGRLAQRLKYKGTTFYPETVFHALQDLTEVQASFIEVRSVADGADDVTVVVGCEGGATDIDNLCRTLQAHLRVVPTVVIKPTSEVVETLWKDGGRKPKKFFDYRSC